MSLKCVKKMALLGCYINFKLHWVPQGQTFYSPTSFDSVPYTNTSYPNKYDLKNEITLCTENAMYNIDLIHSTKDRIKKCIELF